MPGTSAIAAEPVPPGSGGSCGASVSGSRRPTKPNFHSSCRADADAETRPGSGRRGGSTGSTPRQARNLPYATGRPLATWSATADAGRYVAVAPVVRNKSTSAPSAITTNAITWPGAVDAVASRDAASRDIASSVAARRSAGWAAPVLPTVAPRSSTSASFATPSRLTSDRVARMGARDDDAIDVAGRELRLLEGLVPGPLAQRDVPRLAEALLPHLRTGVAGRAPAVEELGGDRRRADVLGEQRRRTRRHRRAARLHRRRPRLRRRRRAGRCACRPRPRAPCPIRRVRCEARPRPNAAPPRGRGRPRRRRGATRRGWRWHWSCRGTRASRSRTTPCRAAANRLRPAVPAGRPRSPSWWCPRRRRRHSGCPCPRPSPRTERSSIGRAARGGCSRPRSEFLSWHGECRARRRTYGREP